jgi:hypothetical protein
VARHRHRARGAVDLARGAQHDRWLGVRSYPPAVLFAVAILFIIAVLLHYSTVISRLSDQNVLLAQKLALLERDQRERADRG